MSQWILAGRRPDRRTVEKGHCCRCPPSPTSAHLQGAIVTSHNRAAVIVQIQSGLEPENTSRSALHAATSSRSCRIHQSTTSRDTLWRQMSQISSRPGPAQHILAASVRMPFSAFRGGAQEFALGATLVACSPCGCSVVPVRRFALQQRERWTSQANLPIIRAGDMFMYRCESARRSCWSR